jgi:hypothetical protein
MIMSEAEWLACTDPMPMARLLRSTASDRKSRLFVCACFRSFWHPRADPRRKSAIEITERFVDGLAKWSDLSHAIEEARSASSEEDQTLRLLRLASPYDEYRFGDGLPLIVNELPIPVDGGEPAACFLRDIFGNPFHPLPPPPEAVAPVAERIYSGEWQLMPILGEWLQEHGYWSEGEHCLDPNNHHVKGCWVVDWVTGRE